MTNSESFRPHYPHAALSRETGKTTVARPLASKSEACGKAILMGEHAVVYGAKAVAMPLPQVRLRLNLTPQLHRSSETNHLVLDDRRVADQVSAVIAESFEVLGCQPFGLSLVGTSNLPFGAGLGSSAAICVGILRSIANSLGRGEPPHLIASYANQLEKRFHGNPSGLDTAVVAFRDVIEFQKRSAGANHVERLSVHHDSGPWDFALIDSGVRSTTIRMIEVAKPYFTSPSHGENRIAAFDRLSTSVVEALRCGDRKLLASSMNEARRLLAETGVVNDTMIDIMDQCRAIGLAGCKPTGAGGGGMILAMLDGQRVCEQLEALQSSFGKERIHWVSLPCD